MFDDLATATNSAFVWSTIGRSQSSAAPPTPCRIRQKTSSPSEWEVPQKNEAIIKMNVETIR